MGATEQRLLSRLRAAGKDVLEAGIDVLPEAVIGAVETAMQEDDLEEAIRLWDDLFGRLESLKTMAARQAEVVNTALLHTMAESGAGSVDCGHHRLSLVEGSEGFAVMDPEAIPGPYLRPRPPEPDKKAIGRALKAGEDIPGVARTNPAPHLRRTAKKRV